MAPADGWVLLFFFLCLNRAAAAAEILFHVAPMQCYTNVHLRVLLRALSAKAVLWTEMEKDADLLASEKACALRLRHTPAEQPLVLQLGGNSPLRMARVAQRALPFGFDEVNINCGCPSVQAGGAAFGASLMLQPALTRELAEAISQASPGVPVSVKCRLGVHERVSADGSALDDSYEGLAEYIRQVTATDAVSHVVVHARAAILAGLSPGQNRCIPPLRPEWVLRLARDFPQIRVTLNGGVGSISRCRALAGAGRIDGVMAGRWLLRRPLDLWEIDSEPTIRAAPGSTGTRIARSRAAALTSFGAYAEQCLAGRTASLAQLIPPLLLVAEQVREDLLLIESERDDDVTSPSPDELLELLHVLWECAATLVPGVAQIDHVRDMEGDADGLAASARKLSKLLAKAMGNKVANKVLRNRAE